ncbi:MAG: hypothetical protein HKN04_03380 [Rhodothermaceae bacterium]|nr:hypothetical protein [Rhodothermaceae bacterium]
MFKYGLSDMVSQALDLPPYVLGWLAWLVAVTVIAPIFFIRHREARVVLYWQAANAAFGLALWSVVGLVRLLSLSHVLFWTPAVIYLSQHRPERRQTLFDTWVYLALISMGISLALDVVELVRYASGARELLGGYSL